MRLLKLSFRITVDAVRHFLDDDGWAIASHIALSTLMALFPFLIVVTALAGFFFGSRNWPTRPRVCCWKPGRRKWPGRSSQDITGVLTNARGDVLTFGVAFALYFASSGVESLRIGLNRAYNTTEPRAWWLLRLELILYVLVGAVAILAFSFLVVLAPLIWTKLVHYVPRLAPFDSIVTFARYGAAAAVMIVALLIVHLWLPAGRRSFADIAPGVIATLLLWLGAGAAFGRYLASYAFAYVSMYAGLASAMIALVFLYVCATIFIFGGELNAGDQARRAQKSALAARRFLHVLERLQAGRGRVDQHRHVAGRVLVLPHHGVRLAGSPPRGTPCSGTDRCGARARSGWPDEACFKCAKCEPWMRFCRIQT